MCYWSRRLDESLISTYNTIHYRIKHIHLRVSPLKGLPWSSWHSTSPVAPLTNLIQPSSGNRYAGVVSQYTVTMLVYAPWKGFIFEVLNDADCYLYKVARLRKSRASAAQAAPLHIMLNNLSSPLNETSSEMVWYHEVPSLIFQCEAHTCNLNVQTKTMARDIVSLSRPMLGKTGAWLSTASICNQPSSKNFGGMSDTTVLLQRCGYGEIRVLR